MKNKKPLILTGVFFLLIILRVIITFLPFADGDAAFIGYSHYLRLFIHDRIFLTALINTVLPHLICAVICVAGLAVLRYLRSKKSKSTIIDRHYFPFSILILFSLNRGVTLLINLIVWQNSIPKYIEPSVPFFRYLFNTVLTVFLPQGIIDGLIFALFFCFVLWIVDLIQKKHLNKNTLI